MFQEFSSRIFHYPLFPIEIDLMRQSDGKPISFSWRAVCTNLQVREEAFCIKFAKANVESVYLLFLPPSHLFSLMHVTGTFFFLISFCLVLAISYFKFYENKGFLNQTLKEFLKKKVNVMFYL